MKTKIKCDACDTEHDAGQPCPMCNVEHEADREYVILSVERRTPDGFFVAVHGNTPMYADADKAMGFKYPSDAKSYANLNLFVTELGSLIMTRAEARKMTQ